MRDLPKCPIRPPNLDRTGNPCESVPHPPRFIPRTVMLLVALCCVSMCPTTVTARLIEKTPSGGKNRPPSPQRAMILDGSTVHNVGELQMNVFNWGEWGSRPGTAEPYSFAPSAQWPAGSGVEYLFSAGLWVGAIKSGIPAVSTATYDRELRPDPDERDIMYRTEEGAIGGNRPPDAYADDDEDGLVDEDWLDGYDNDGDGRIDEDFAAISRLMFSCTYADDHRASQQIYPEHNPLHITIRQESYQWASPRLDDFIAVQYHITNTGDDILEDVYIGMFVDGDVGPLDQQNYWEDDLVARRSAGSLCTEVGVVSGVQVAYMYDSDGDGGRTPGRFGVMFVDHTTDTAAVVAPRSLSPATFAYFSGRQSFAFGGDPTNDFERYEILSERSSAGDATLARDYRMLVSAGPFPLLFPDSTVSFTLAFVAGGSDDELIDNAASAMLAYQGLWFDMDGDPTTGVEGRETKVWGSDKPNSIWEDQCRKPATSILDSEGCDGERIDDRFKMAIRHTPADKFIWSNQDCQQECMRKSACGYTERDSFHFRTGVGGRETQIHWIVRSAPPPPNMRIDDHAKDGLVIYWDNFSETVPALTQFLDGGSKFEGYQIWRADEWTRPLGTSKATGPQSRLWSALFQADLVNSYGDDVGLDRLRYDPLNSLLSISRKRELIESVKAHLIEFPDIEPPCPQGVVPEVCDTVKAMARWELGVEGGRRYYRYVDRSMTLGLPYFYSVVSFDRAVRTDGSFAPGMAGDPAANFVFVEPQSPAQPLYTYDRGEIYVVPNPVTRESLAEWSLGPTNDDPTGIKVEFRNLPRTTGVIRVYTLAGDLVKELHFDARSGEGTVRWDLVSRNGQDIASGVYLYAIEFDAAGLNRVIKKFTVIR